MFNLMSCARVFRKVVCLLCLLLWRGCCVMAAAPSPATGSHFSADAWYFTKEELRHSASVRDGYTTATETKERRAVCAFMQETGKKLGLCACSLSR